MRLELVWLTYTDSGQGYGGHGDFLVNPPWLRQVDTLSWKTPLRADPTRQICCCTGDGEGGDTPTWFSERKYSWQAAVIVLELHTRRRHGR
jgi:hypothetical protein